MILVLGVAMIGACKTEAPRKTRAVTIEADIAGTADVPVLVNAIGSVEPSEHVELRAQVTGVVSEVTFKEGDAVTAGQILLKLDRRPFEAVVAQASANLTAAEIQSGIALRNLDRGRPLHDKGMISDGDFDSLQAAFETATAAVKVQQAALRSARLNLEFTTIQAPLPGRAGRQLVYPGDIVNAGQTPLVQINRTMPVYVRFAVPEKDIDALRRAFEAGNVSVTAQAPAVPDKQFTGSLTFVDNQIDTKTGSLALKATFANDDEGLWPGQFVQVKATVGMLSNAVVVPAHAVQVSQSGSYVFVVENSTARLRKVTPGSLYQDLIVVQEGVVPGEMVVTDGHIKLVDGTAVELRKQDPGNESASQSAPAGKGMPE